MLRSVSDADDDSDDEIYLLFLRTSWDNRMLSDEDAEVTYNKDITI